MVAIRSAARAIDRVGVPENNRSGSVFEDGDDSPGRLFGDVYLRVFSRHIGWGNGETDNHEPHNILLGRGLFRLGL